MRMAWWALLLATVLFLCGSLGFAASLPHVIAQGGIVPLVIALGAILFSVMGFGSEAVRAEATLRRVFPPPVMTGPFR
jgi:hypothetical protein